MAYTVKQLLESKQFPDMRLVTCKENLNQEIKGIRIIDIEDMERYLTGGELLLTNMKVYFGETDREFRKHLNELEKKQVSGFIIKQHPDMVQKVNYYDILLKFCSERNIPVIEISEDEYYWGIIKYVILQIYDENIARLIYFKLTHDNISNMLLDGEDFEDPTKNILFLLSSMIGNPVALYYSNLTCCASTTQDLSDFVFEKNVEKYKPDIVTRFEYKKQRKEHTQYITKIHVLGRTEIYLVVTEVNMPLTILDYMALENAVITLQYSFMETYAKNEIEKKYQRDIEYSLLNGLLTGDELSKAAGMLKLKDTAQYCVVSFHTISSNSEDYYTKEELEEIGVIEGEIQRLLPDEHIYRNLNQIVCIHEIKPGETQAGFREEMEKLLKVSSSPHVRDGVTTQRLMFDVVIAMIPASVYGVWQFGMNALLVLIATVIASVAAEYLYEKLMHKPITISDGSAVVTGMILALNMPPEIPVWIPVLGAFFAIIVVKQLYGGLGQNFMNPALAGRCFLMISFAGKMTDFAVSDSFRGVVDTVSGATPLAALKQNGFTDSSVSVLHMFIGDIQGTIGETSALAILIGAAILLVFKVIDLKIPLTYIGSFAVFVILYMLGTGKGFDVNYLFSHIFGINGVAWATPVAEITSLIVSEFVRSISILSIPGAAPACGGAPY